MLFAKHKTPTQLDEAISEVLSDMKGFTSDSDEYAVMVDQLVKLQSLKSCEKTQAISKDTLAIVTGNLIGIVLILSYEKTNVITTRALQFMLRKATF
jgi:hypothetical protein